MAARPPSVHPFPHAAHAAPTHGHTLGAPRRYDAFVELFFLGRRRSTFMALARAAGVQPGQRVLDVGCGTGYFARLLADLVRPGGLVIGVDPSHEMIEHARRTRRSPSVCEFEVGVAERLSFPSAHFDVVVSSLVMHHLPADLQMRALAEIRRVLRPGGTLLIAEAQVPRAAGWRWLARLHGYDRMARLVPDLRALLAQAGLVPTRTGEAPPWLRYIVATCPPQ